MLSQAIAGLATSATAQATLQRVMLFDLKDKIIEPFGETAQQVFARISAMRDSLDGPQVCSLDTLLQRHICPCNEFVHLRWLLGCIHPCLGVQAYRRASMSPQWYCMPAIILLFDNEQPSSSMPAAWRMPLIKNCQVKNCW